MRAKKDNLVHPGTPSASPKTKQPTSGDIAAKQLQISRKKGEQAAFAAQPHPAIRDYFHSRCSLRFRNATKFPRLHAFEHFWRIPGTARHEAGDVLTAARDFGAQYTFTKPFAPEVLLAAVRTVIEG